MASESLSEVHSSVSVNKKTKWRRLLAYLGPAYLVSVGYMDPGNWATDIAGGSRFGYKLVWVLLMSNLIALLLQSLSARLGIIRGMDLAQASKNTYPKWANIPLYILAEISIAACDLAEIVGMAIGLNLLFDIPLIWGISITALDTILLLFLLKKGMRAMEMFIISLVFIIGVSFLIEMFIVQPVYADVLAGFIPSKLNGEALYIAIGIIGATVMPHNLYLHSSLVQTRKTEPTPEGKKRAIRFNFIDTAVALNLAFFVNAAILILAAAAFHANGFFEVAEIQDASELLSNLFGRAAPIFFGIALVAAGQSSTITGTLAGQIIMEGHLNLRIQPWLRRLITRLFAISPAIFTILYFGEESLGKLLVLSQVVLSLQLGFAIIPLIHFTSDRKTMKEFTIKTWLKVLAWLSAGIIIALNIKLVMDEIMGWLETSENKIVIYTIVIPVALACFALLVYVFIHPYLNKKIKETRQIPHEGASLKATFKKPVYRHIGICVDFGQIDQKIIENALSQGGVEARYSFIHVVETAVARYLGSKARDLETIMDEENLKKYRDQLVQEGFNADIHIGFGNVADEIAKIVEREGIDFLIMGSHGHKAIKDMVLGTTVEALRHRINIPLLIIKGG